MLTGSASLPSLRDRLRRPPARWCRSATGNCHVSILLACQSLIRRLMVGRFAPAVVCSGSVFPLAKGVKGSAVSAPTVHRDGCHSRNPSNPHVPLADDDPLGAGQLAQAAGAAGVDLVGADADLGAEAELAAVVEAGAGVDHHGRAVDLGDESLGGREIAGDDRLGVARAVPGDVVDRLVDRVDDGDGQDLVEDTRYPSRPARRASWPARSRGGRVAAELDSLAHQGLRPPWAGKTGAIARWTSSVSAALQTPGRWTLALTMILTAMSRSQRAST